MIELSKHIMAPRRWRPAMLWLAVGLVIVCIANFATRAPGSSSLWTDWLDPLITITTVVAAVFLGLQATLDELPKKLTIHFMYENRYALTCWEASLAGEGDIRQWAQQVGKQMCGNKKLLEFDPFPRISPPRTEGGDKGLRRVYDIRIFLTEEPPLTGYLVWGPGKNDKASLLERPSEPLSVTQVKERQGEEFR